MKLLTIEQASELLNTTVGTLYVWVHQRKIPFVKLGRKLAFKEEALIEYINSNTYLPV
jgi:excisionase family DNA binding protein